jgi:hypothetical protein
MMIKRTLKKSTRPRFTAKELALIDHVVSGVVVHLDSLVGALPRLFPKQRQIDLLVQQLRLRRCCIEYLRLELMGESVDWAAVNRSPDTKVLHCISLVGLWCEVLHVGRVEFRASHLEGMLRSFVTILDHACSGDTVAQQTCGKLFTLSTQQFDQWDKICGKVLPYLEWLDAREN